MSSSNQEISVLHVAEVLKGGTASYIDELLSYQTQELDKENIHLLAPESQIIGVTNATKVNVHLFKDQGSRVSHVLRMRTLLKKVFSEHRFDIVHIHGTFAGFAVRAFFGFKKNRPKIIYCSHGWAFDRDSEPWKNRVIGLVEKILSRWCESIICISDHDYRSAIKHGLPKNKLVVFKNGISEVSPSQSHVEWPECKMRFLFVGRFDNQKGIDLFFEAMSHFDKDVFAYAIGDTSLGDKPLPSMPSNVKLTGWLTRTEVQQYLESCDVFVMPSRWEGFGLSALEAMRVGKPVIASNIGGLPELVIQGVNGLLIQPNSVSSLVDAMKTILDIDVKALGNSAKKRFESEFTSLRLNNQIIDLYRKFC